MGDKSIAGSKPMSPRPLPEGMIRNGGQNLPFSFGTRVRVDGNHGIEGVVTGYAIYPQISEVKVSWFANGDSKADWFAEWRVAGIVE